MNFEAKLLNRSTTQTNCDHRKIRDRGNRRQNQVLLPSLEMQMVFVVKGGMEEGQGCCRRLTWLKRKAAGGGPGSPGGGNSDPPGGDSILGFQGEND